MLAAILECLGEKMLLKLLGRLQVHVNHPHSQLTPRATVLLNILLSKLRTMIPIIVLFHKGIFYMYGRYYSIGKRIAGLNYAKVCKFKHDEYSFAISLFFCLFLQDIIYRFMVIDQWILLAGD